MIVRYENVGACHGLQKLEALRRPGTYGLDTRYLRLLLSGTLRFAQSNQGRVYLNLIGQRPTCCAEHHCIPRCTVESSYGLLPEVSA